MNDLNFASFPRIRAVRAALETCDALDVACDVRITAAIQASSGVVETLNGDGELHPVGDSEAARPFDHRYVLDVDGNSFSARFVSFLASNSVALKFSGGIEQFFTSWLEPDTHFVAIDHTFSDLTDQLRSLRSNKSHAEWMAAQASRFAHNYLDVEFVDRFMVSALYRLNKHFKR